MIDLSRSALTAAALAAACLLLASPVRAQVSASDLIVRIERLENQIRQLTGTLEQLQFHNQQLEQQVRRMQEDADVRSQELGAKAGARPPPVRPVGPTPAPAPAGSMPPR